MLKKKTLKNVENKVENVEKRGKKVEKLIIVGKTQKPSKHRTVFWV